MVINSRFLDDLPSLIRSIGHPNFVGTCLSVLNTALKIDHIVLLTFSDNLKPRLLDGDSPGKENLSVFLARKYIKYFYLSDPNMDFMHTHSEKPTVPVLLKLRASEIKNAVYREQLFERYQVIERLSWLGQTSGLWYATNLYREKRSGYFSEREIETVNGLAPVVVACIEQHLQLISPTAWEAGQQPSIEWFEELLRELGHGLTPREIQVCARALLGMTRNGIGLDLDIKPTTVNTLTQRAYAKINISTLNELFALCLRAVSLRNDAIYESSLE